MHDRLPRQILDLSERHPPWRFWLGGGALAAGAALGTLWAPLLGDVALTLLGAGSLGAAGGLSWLRGKLARLPMTLAPRAFFDGEEHCFRFRAWVGRGRPLRHAKVWVRFADQAGVEPIAIDAPYPVLVGPWTVVVRDPELRLAPDARIHVRLEAQGEEPVERVYQGAEPGRFATPFVLDGGVRWTPRRWGERLES